MERFIVHILHERDVQKIDRDDVPGSNLLSDKEGGTAAERERIQTRIDEKIIKYTDSDKFLVIEFVSNVTQYH